MSWPDIGLGNRYQQLGSMRTLPISELSTTTNQNWYYWPPSYDTTNINPLYYVIHATEHPTMYVVQYYQFVSFPTITSSTTIPSIPSTFFNDSVKSTPIPAPSSLLSAIRKPSRNISTQTPPPRSYSPTKDYSNVPSCTCFQRVTIDAETQTPSPHITHSQQAELSRVLSGLSANSNELAPDLCRNLSNVLLSNPSMNALLKTIPSRRDSLISVQSMTNKLAMALDEEALNSRDESIVEMIDLEEQLEGLGFTPTSVDSNHPSPHHHQNVLHSIEDRNYVPNSQDSLLSEESVVTNDLSTLSSSLLAPSLPIPLHNIRPPPAAHPPHITQPPYDGSLSPHLTTSSMSSSVEGKPYKPSPPKLTRKQSPTPSSRTSSPPSRTSSKSKVSPRTQSPNRTPPRNSLQHSR